MSGFVLFFFSRMEAGRFDALYERKCCWWSALEVAFGKLISYLGV